MDSADIYAIVQLGIIGLSAVILIIGVCISGPFVASYWYKTRRAEVDGTLKQAMIERGMTAEQICAVIEAGDGRKPERPTQTSNVNDWREWANDWKDWAHRWKNRRAKA
jgi:hypothetical protein